MNYYDDNMELWIALVNEYEDWYDHVSRKLNSVKKNVTFDDFVNQKEELGLRTEGFKIYRIVDEKKWTLARIKYGI